MVTVAVEYDPKDLRRQRRRARITLAELADRLEISGAAISLYETGKRGWLPFDLTGADYERALEASIRAKGRAL